MPIPWAPVRLERPLTRPAAASARPASSSPPLAAACPRRPWQPPCAPPRPCGPPPAHAFARWPGVLSTEPSLSAVFMSPEGALTRTPARSRRATYLVPRRRPVWSTGSSGPRTADGSLLTVHRDHHALARLSLSRTALDRIRRPSARTRGRLLLPKLGHHLGELQVDQVGGLERQVPERLCIQRSRAAQHMPSVRPAISQASFRPWDRALDWSPRWDRNRNVPRATT